MSKAGDRGKEQENGVCGNGSISCKGVDDEERYPSPNGFLVGRICDAASQVHGGRIQGHHRKPLVPHLRPLTR